MSKHIVFVSLTSSLRIEEIFSHLFNQGYAIAPVNDDYIMSDDDSPVVLLGLTIISKEPESPNDFRRKFRQFLTDSMIYHYGVFVFSKNKIAWGTSNISLNKTKTWHPVKKPKVNVPYLRLVENHSPKE